MEFKGNLISPVYYQLYMTFTKAEINSFYAESKEKLKEIYMFRQEQTLNKTLDEHPYETINFKQLNLEEEFTNLVNGNNEKSLEFQKELQFYVQSSIEYCIHYEIEKRGMAVVTDWQLNYLCKIAENMPLTATCSFCFVSRDYKLKLPTYKFKKYEVDNEEFNALIDALLITRGYYREIVIPKIIQGSICIFDINYAQDNSVEKDIEYLFDDLEDLYQLDSNLFVNKKIDDIIEIEDESEGIISYKVRKIVIRKAMNLSDKIVEEINLLGLKTKLEFYNKIHDVYNNLYNTNVTVMSILKAIAKLNDFKIDKYVLSHFEREMGNDIEENDFNNYYQNPEEYIAIQYVTAVIFNQCEFEYDDKSLRGIEEEYAVLEVSRSFDFEPESFKEFQDSRFPFIILYKYFQNKKLFKE